MTAKSNGCHELEKCIGVNLALIYGGMLMVRLPRFVLPGQPQHVIVRGNNRQSIFRQEVDYALYLEKLKLACAKHQCDVHAYVLMTNHAHLIVTPHLDDSIGKSMQMLGRNYVQYFNKKYDRTGTLWEGRYRATLIDSEKYLLTCYRYVELNPVRAKGMVDHPGDYPWSSYLCNADGELNELISPHEEYLGLGSTPDERQAAYRGLFKERLMERDVEVIRQATNKAWVLGGQEFKDKIEKTIRRQAAPKQRGGDRKSRAYLTERDERGCV
jgi:putative transposase